MIELDLAGRKVAVSDTEIRVLLHVAESSSGSSLGARDLATRLKNIPLEAATNRRWLVFTRQESRALQHLIVGLDNRSETFEDLKAALMEALG